MQLHYNQLTDNFFTDRRQLSPELEKKKPKRKGKRERERHRVIMNQPNYCAKSWLPDLPVEYMTNKWDSDDEEEFPNSLYTYPIEAEYAKIVAEQDNNVSELHPFKQDCYLLGGNNNNKNKRRNNSQQVKKKQPKRESGIPKSLRPNDIMPPSYNSRMNFLDPNMQIAAPTFSYAVKSLRINSVYDPDPDILSTGVAGFNFLMLKYEFFRVDHCTVDWRPSNNEQFALIVGMVFSQVELEGTISSRQEAIDALENGISTKPITLVNRTGGPSEKVIQHGIHPKFLLGNPKLYEGDENYTGTQTSDPPDKLWVNLIVVSPANTVLLLNGVVGACELHFKIKFFGSKVLDDVVSLKQMLSKLTREEQLKLLGDDSLKCKPTVKLRKPK